MQSSLKSLTCVAAEVSECVASLYHCSVLDILASLSWEHAKDSGLLGQSVLALALA